MRWIISLTLVFVEVKKRWIINLMPIQHAVPIDEIRNNQSAENGLPRGTMATCSAVLEQWKHQLCTLFAFHFPSPFNVLFFFSEAYAAHIFRNIFFPRCCAWYIIAPRCSTAGIKIFCPHMDFIAFVFKLLSEECSIPNIYFQHHLARYFRHPSKITCWETIIFQFTIWKLALSIVL